MENEVFQLVTNVEFRKRGNPELMCKISINATDRKAPVKCIQKLFENDTSGTIKDIFQQAVLTHVSNAN